MISNRVFGFALVWAAVPLPHPYWLSAWFAGMVFVVAAMFDE